MPLMHISLSSPFSLGASDFLDRPLLLPSPAIRFLLSCSLKIPSEDTECSETEFKVEDIKWG